jgi:hypothetical protein
VISFQACVRELGALNAVTEGQLKTAAYDVTREDAHAALERLQRLESGRPTRGQLLRGAAIGSVMGPLASNASKLISKGEFHSPREVAGQVAGGLIMGTAVPLFRQKVESTAERRTLKDYINAGHGGRLATQIESKLGTP